MWIDKFYEKLFYKLTNPIKVESAKAFAGKHVCLKSDHSKTGFAVAPRIDMVKVFWKDGEVGAEDARLNVKLPIRPRVDGQRKGAHHSIKVEPKCGRHLGKGRAHAKRLLPAVVDVQLSGYFILGASALLFFVPPVVFEWVLFPMDRQNFDLAAES